MATLKIPEQDRTLTDHDAIVSYLAEQGIEYERMEHVPRDTRPRCDAQEIQQRALAR
jgi:hypothetical protein